MKLVTPMLGTALLLAALCGDVGRVDAFEAPSGGCCVCTLCDFSEHCFTGLNPNQSARCTDLCNEANCEVGDLHGQACETFTPLCEVITPAPAIARPVPAMRPSVLVLAALGTALVGIRRLVRRRSSTTRAA